MITFSNLYIPLLYIRVFSVLMKLKEQLTIIELLSLISYQLLSLYPVESSKHPNTFLMKHIFVMFFRFPTTSSVFVFLLKCFTLM